MVRDLSPTPSHSFMPAFKMLLAFVILAASCSVALSQNTSALPIVDLGYELHQASYVNVSWNGDRVAKAAG